MFTWNQSAPKEMTPQLQLPVAFPAPPPTEQKWSKDSTAQLKKPSHEKQNQNDLSIKKTAYIPYGTQISDDYPFCSLFCFITY